MKATVLFVDDDPALLDGLRRALRAEPFEIVCATSAAQALELLEARAVDVVVSDQDMPGMAGTAFLAAVRDRAPETRRFILTGKPALDVAVDAVNNGAVSGFFTKPCPPSELAAAIRTALKDKAQLEAEMERTQKSEMVGWMAGGVAHDISNLLTIISGRSRLLGQPDADPARQQRAAEIIERTSAKGAMLARRFLNLLRQRGEVQSAVSLNDVVHGVEELLPPLLGRAIQLTLDLAPDLRRVLGNAGQLEQVVMNLALNARDAMPSGGRLTVRTWNDRAVVLEISDTGVGMPPEVQEQIFTPFFTTKGPDKGNGLGLATVAMIVRQHGGTIALDSAPGRGSTFVLRFPHIEDEGA